MKNIYLCGTVHLDLAGPERLERVLKTLSPDIIAIESYPESAREILEKRDETKNYDEKILLQKIKESAKFPIEGIRADTALALMKVIGYEVWVPFEYAQESGAQIVHIEDEKRAQKIVKGFLDDIMSNPEKAAPYVEMLKQSPRMLRNLFDFSYEFSFGKDEAEVVERNKVFSEKIKSLNGRILAVVGNDHIYGEEPTLPQLLSEYNPTSLKLVQADYFPSEA